MKFSRQLGYKDPQHYKVCCGQDHVTLVSGTNCPNCEKEWDKCTDYFVLGLNHSSLYGSGTKLKDHLAHWEERGTWFKKENIAVAYKEVWDGSRFRDLHLFWNEGNQHCLPACCHSCSNILSLEEMLECAGGNHILRDDNIQLSCGECTFQFAHVVQGIKGNPLNQAFIFHEHGFNAFMKKSRGIAAILISNACSKKELRLLGKSLNVYSFVPSHLLKEGIPHKMDTFLKPLIEEITMLF